MKFRLTQAERERLYVGALPAQPPGGLCDACGVDTGGRIAAADTPEQGAQLRAGNTGQSLAGVFGAVVPARKTGLKTAARAAESGNPYTPSKNLRRRRLVTSR